MYSYWLQHSLPSSLRYCHHVYYVLSPNLLPCYRSGLHNLCHPTIRDGSTWTKFGARGEHGDTLIYGISSDGSKNFNIRTCEHMILGQLRIWARTTTYAALLGSWWDPCCGVLRRRRRGHPLGEDTWWLWTHELSSTQPPCWEYWPKSLFHLISCAHPCQSRPGDPSLKMVSDYASNALFETHLLIEPKKYIYLLSIMFHYIFMDNPIFHG